MKLIVFRYKMLKIQQCVYFILFYTGFCVLSESTQNEVNPKKSVLIHPHSSYDHPRRLMDPKDELEPQEELGFDLTPEEMTKFKIWPQGVVPYYIDIESFRDKVLRDSIREILGEVNSLTGLNFMELNVAPTSDERWVLFINRRGQLECADHSILNFTNTGPQRVVLGYDCMSMHGELGEAVLSIAGVPPQHNAPNRDDYIEVLDHNIMTDKKYLFRKLKDDEWLFQDIPYDFKSAGHYHFHKYSKNGQATIKAKQSNTEGLSDTNKGLSSYDIRKIKMLYNYISKKRSTDMPECFKLFRPGSNFDRFEPKIESILHRKRPNEISSVKADVDAKMKEKNRFNVKSSAADTVTNSKSDDEEEGTDQEVYVNFRQKQTRQVRSKDRYKKKITKNPLVFMSDFETDDERNDKVKTVRKEE